MTDAMAIQHGGEHYKGMAIQPFEFGHANRYDAEIFSVIKYVSRHHLKGGAEDLRKAAHIVSIRVAMNKKWGPPQAAQCNIHPEHYCTMNELGDDETQIIKNCHAWGVPSLTDRLGDDHCANLIVNQIGKLIRTTYEEET